MKPIIKHKNLLKNMELFTVYILACQALTDSGDKNKIVTMKSHLENSKSESESKKIIQQYVTFQRQ